MYEQRACKLTEKMYMLRKTGSLPGNQIKTGKMFLLAQVDHLKVTR